MEVKEVIAGAGQELNLGLLALLLRAVEPPGVLLLFNLALHLRHGALQVALLRQIIQGHLVDVVRTLDRQRASDSFPPLIVDEGDHIVEEGRKGEQDEGLGEHIHVCLPTAVLTCGVMPICC